MKLRKVLCTTFISMILIPMLLFVVVLCVVATIKLNTIQNAYGIKDLDYSSLNNSVQVLNELTKNVHNEMKKIARENPDQFIEPAYLSKLEKRLEKDSSFLVVYYKKEFIYVGDNDEEENWYEILPEYEAVEDESHFEDGFYVGGALQALVKKVDFVDSNGGYGSAFIVTKSKVLLDMAKSFMNELLISVIFVLLVTSGILTWWIYRSVTMPLKKLRQATQNMKEGNLDFTLEVDSDDTLGELCADFEEMRKRLKMTIEEKMEYDKESKELISNISHDLKTPITAIKGYVEGIMDGVADTPEKMDRYIKTIYNKTNDMDKLINELTFYSKIDTNRIPYVFNRINVAAYFNDCVDEISDELAAKNIKLQYFNYVESDVKVIADVEQMKRVINNIISNSIKYMDKEQGIIIIRIKDVGDFIQVEIEDNGKGIGVKELPYIFDRFYRTDASRNSKQGGSGIGLSIVKKIVEDHGGQIWANSKENTGTVMCFVLRKYTEAIVNE